MNLILEINNMGYGRHEEKITIVMVTHNEDL
jgi:ABC-type lipoprotein export system ATPase subunit